MEADHQRLDSGAKPEAHRSWHLEDAAGPHFGQLSIASRHVAEPDQSHRGAMEAKTGQATGAFTARQVRHRGDQIARLEGRDACADLLDDTGKLVSHNGPGRQFGVVIGSGVQIRAADSAVTYANDDFSRAGLGIRQFDDFERLPHRLEPHAFIIER